MNMRLPLITNTQTAKLTQPGKRSLHYPTPSPQTAAVPRVAFRQERQDMARGKSLANHRCVVSAITDNAVRTTSRSSSVSLQRWNRIVMAVHHY
jgi:hypothetical protein